MTGLGEGAQMFFFTDILGRDGFWISHTGESAPRRRVGVYSRALRIRGIGLTEAGEGDRGRRGPGL